MLVTELRTPYTAWSTQPTSTLLSNPRHSAVGHLLLNLLAEPLFSYLSLNRQHLAWIRPVLPDAMLIQALLLKSLRQLLRQHPPLLCQLPALSLAPGKGFSLSHSEHSSALL